MLKILLLKIWRLLPSWLQAVASRFVRPLFQVFAAAVIFDPEGRILLVKLTYQRLHPWGLPGGSLDYSETPEDAILREVREETGWRIAIDDFLFVKSWPPDRIGLYYHCHVEDGEFQPSDEVSEFGYFPLDELPDVRPLDVVLIKQIHDEKVRHELA
jgi:8-oxo-dGTP pyrophosphatase MutT (NUDIX family)